jgi:hypothetical protein
MYNTVISINEYNRIRNKLKLIRHLDKIYIKRLAWALFITRIIPFFLFVIFIIYIFRNTLNTIFFMINYNQS